MRLSGLFLIVVGALLCASIAWATIGFFAMALGLICLQIPIRQVPVSGNAVGANVVSPPPVEQITVSTSQSSTLAAAAGSGAWKVEFGWDTLVARDEDLANVERLLSCYGAIYVDQLRALYCVFNNKALLPSILSLIVESAVHEAARTASALAGMSAREGCKPDTTVPTRMVRPTEAVDSMIAPFASQDSTANPSSGEGELLSHPDDLRDAEVTSLEVASEASVTADVEDVVNLTNIFDQISRNKN